MLTNELGTLSTKAGCFTSGLGTFLTGKFVRFFDLFESVLDLKEMVDVEGSLEATSTHGREGGGSTTLGTFQLTLSEDHSIKTVLTVDMETGEKSRVGVVIQTDWAGELVLHFRESLLGRSWFVSH